MTKDKQNITNDNAIHSYIHCGLCYKDFAEKSPHVRDQSPQSYSRLSVGWTKQGFQVWCERHECNVLHVDFEGTQHPANTTRKA